MREGGVETYKNKIWKNCTQIGTWTREVYNIYSQKFYLKSLTDEGGDTDLKYELPWPNKYYPALMTGTLSFHVGDSVDTATLALTCQLLARASSCDTITSQYFST